MINLKQELQNFSPINLKNLEENNSEIADNIRNSVILYNKSLDSLRMSSEDIAIIELKKAISMNPNFYEAMNLLGICYSYINENTKASEIFGKVIAAENNSVKAMKYLSQLNSNDDALMPNDSKAKNIKKINTKNDNKSTSFVEGLLKIKKDGKADIAKYILGFVIGVAITVLISFFVFKGTDNGLIVSDNNDTTNPVNTAETKYQIKYDNLNKDYTKLKSDLDAANKETDYYKNVIKLAEIEKMVSKGEFEAAADNLVLLKTVPFITADKEKYDSLSKTTMQKAVLIVSNEGGKLMDLKNYQEALARLNKAQTYGGSELPYMDRVLYYIGKCYVALNDKNNATIAFQSIVDNYPNSSYAKYSIYKIKELAGS